MKDIELTKSIDKAIAIKLKAVDIIIKDLIEPIEKLGNPEKLIGKPYEEWTGEDIQLLTRVYGAGNNSPLANLIFKKKYEEVLAEERATAGE